MSTHSAAPGSSGGSSHYSHEGGHSLVRPMLPTAVSTVSTLSLTFCHTAAMDEKAEACRSSDTIETKCGETVLACCADFKWTKRPPLSPGGRGPPGHHGYPSDSCWPECACSHVLERKNPAETIDTHEEWSHALRLDVDRSAVESTLLGGNWSIEEVVEEEEEEWEEV